MLSRFLTRVFQSMSFTVLSNGDISHLRDSVQGCHADWLGKNLNALCGVLKCLSALSTVTVPQP